jgi:hypothetical protein
MKTGQAQVDGCNKGTKGNGRVQMKLDHVRRRSSKWPRQSSLMSRLFAWRGAKTSPRPRQQAVPRRGAFKGTLIAKGLTKSLQGPAGRQRA